MNFIPLAIWCAGMVIFMAYEDRTMMLEKIERHERNKQTNGSVGILFVGAMFFLCVGILSDINGG